MIPDKDEAGGSSPPGPIIRIPLQRKGISHVRHVAGWGPVHSEFTLRPRESATGSLLIVTPDQRPPELVQLPFDETFDDALEHR